MPLLPLFTPPTTTWRPLIDLRTRFERRVDKDFSESRSDNASDFLSRTRVGFEVKHNQLTGQFQMQVANDEHWQLSGNKMIERRDVRLALVKSDISGLDVTLGRQAIKKGSGRLVSDFDWNNVGCGFDALRLTQGKWDVAAGQIAFAPSANFETRFAYASNVNSLGETLVLGKWDPNGEVYTLDHIAKVKLGRWGVDGELAVQSGNVSGKDLSAAAGYFKGTYALSKQTDLLTIGAFATGGSSADATHTFDHNMGAFRGSNGIATVVGWRNVQFGAVTLCHRPIKSLAVSASYFRFGLWDRKDAFYTAGGTVSKGTTGSLVDASGESGKDIGDEFSLDAKWQANSHWTYSGGLALFRAGGFVKSFNGSDTNDQWYGYVMASFKF